MLSLGIAHKWSLLSLTRICENGKLKKLRVGESRGRLHTLPSGSN